MGPHRERRLHHRYTVDRGQPQLQGNQRTSRDRRRRLGILPLPTTYRAPPHGTGRNPRRLPHAARRPQPGLRIHSTLRQNRATRPRQLLRRPSYRRNPRRLPLERHRARPCQLPGGYRRGHSALCAPAMGGARLPNALGQMSRITPHLLKRWEHSRGSEPWVAPWDSSYKLVKNKEPTSGLEQLSCSSYEFACVYSSPCWCVRKLRLFGRFSMIWRSPFVPSVPVRISPVAVNPFE